MIIDFHTHVYPDKIARKGVDYVGDFYGFHLETLGTIEHLSACCREAARTRWNPSTPGFRGCWMRTPSASAPSIP